MLHSPQRSASSLIVKPRVGLDPSLRLKTYGRIRPLEEDLTWWERIFRR